MCWFNWFGIGLQVVGLLGAMYLLARLHETVTGHQVIALRWIRTAWRHVRVFTLRLLGRRPGPVTVEAEPATIKLSAVPVGVTTTQAPMPDGLAVHAQIAWLENYVRSVEARHNDLSLEVRRQANAQDDAVRAARSHAEREISKAVDEARSEFRRLVGQDIGWEIVYLTTVAIGVVMAALPC
jgi:tetrahydromethanopterin S-methyltransferase subunit G